MKITVTKQEKEFDCTAAWRIIGQILHKAHLIDALNKVVEATAITDIQFH